ncbi:MAG TPA: NUDIX domain-containing protein [Patescibacteria group bacterium]|nr:NUDIX domain-containing protein [Patescibacteria group bacterium]
MVEKEIVTPTAAAVISRDNKVVLVTHGEKAGHITGIKGLPSGRVEKGETERQTVVREIGEETNLTVSPDDLAEFEGNYFQAKIPRKDGSVNLYGWRVFSVTSFSGEIAGNDETVPEWVPISQIASLDEEGKLLPNVRTAIENALREEP